GLHAVADEAEYFQLAVGEGVHRRVVGVFAAVNRAPQHRLAHRRAQVDLAGHDLANRIDDLLGGLLLGDVSHGPGAQGPFGVEVFAVHGPHQDAGARIAGLDPLDEVDAVSLLEADVGDDDVGLPVDRQLHRLGRVLGLAAD